MICIDRQRQRDREKNYGKVILQVCGILSKANKGCWQTDKGERKRDRQEETVAKQVCRDKRRERVGGITLGCNFEVWQQRMQCRGVTDNPNGSCAAFPQWCSLGSVGGPAFKLWGRLPDLVRPQPSRPPGFINSSCHQQITLISVVSLLEANQLNYP